VVVQRPISNAHVVTTVVWQQNKYWKFAARKKQNKKMNEKGVRLSLKGDLISHWSPSIGITGYFLIWNST
jgi:hypothetical protein